MSSIRAFTQIGSSLARKCKTRAEMTNNHILELTMVRSPIGSVIIFKLEA
jgi:hypothetical protein